MFKEGLVIVLVGMFVVFTFLIIMMASMLLISLLVRRFFPDKDEMNWKENQEEEVALAIALAQRSLGSSV